MPGWSMFTKFLKDTSEESVETEMRFCFREIAQRANLHKKENVDFVDELVSVSGSKTLSYHEF